MVYSIIIAPQIPLQPEGAIVYQQTKGIYLFSITVGRQPALDEPLLLGFRSSSHTKCHLLAIK